MKTGLIKKILLLVSIAAIVVLFYIFDLKEYFTIEYLKGSKDSLSQLYLKNKIPVIGIYIVIYILVTALSLPGAAVMSLAGGALFGLPLGLIVVSFASTIGATLACFISRFLLRDWVQNKFSDRLDTINRGLERDGSFYLFTLRLIPIFPFFIINLVMGLTKIPLRTFFWVSQIGMLPGTAVYINAGREIGKIDSLSGILSPTLIASFAMLGIFPFVVKKLLEFYISRYRREA